MTRVTFREGDVVAHYRRPGEEATLLRSHAGGDWTMRWDAGDEKINRDTSLDLLRRPVRVGDLLVSKYNTSLDVREVAADCYRGWHSDGHMSTLSAALLEGMWTHADGTPIEPPKAEEKQPTSAVAIQALYEAQMGQMQNQRAAEMASARQSGIAQEMQAINARLAQAHAMLGARYEPPAVPSVEQIARALFKTDERVKAFVRSVADDSIRVSPGVYEVNLGAGKRIKAMQIAWERDEQGWRSEATERASNVRAVLLQRNEP